MFILEIIEFNLAIIVISMHLLYEDLFSTQIPNSRNQIIIIDMFFLLTFINKICVLATHRIFTTETHAYLGKWSRISILLSPTFVYLAIS